MNYPESIYRKYEIVEKMICGEKHYGLVRVKSFFGIKYKVLVKVSEHGYIRDWGQSWHRAKYLCTSAIQDDNLMQEWAFERKMTK